VKLFWKGEGGKRKKDERGRGGEAGGGGGGGEEGRRRYRSVQVEKLHCFVADTQKPSVT